MFSSSPGLELVMRAVREGLLLVLLLSAPALLASLVVGLVVAIMQAATQIQEQTISFVPKLIVMLIILAALGPLLGTQLLRFTQSVLAAIATIR